MADLKKGIFFVVLFFCLCDGLLKCSEKYGTSEDDTIKFLKTNPQNIRRYAHSINRCGDIDQFDINFIDPKFIKQKIDESKLFQGKIDLSRRANVDEHQKNTIFNLYQNNILTYVVKTQPFKNLQYQSNTEVLCYEIAKKINIDNIIPHTLKISDGIIASSNVYANETKKHLSLENLNKGGENCNFLQIDVEKALVFSFLTMQQDIHKSNVLLLQDKERVTLGVLYFLYLIDFAYSMSEIKMNECAAKVRMPCFLTKSKKIFAQNLKEIPSDNIKTIVKNISEVNFQDLFKTHELSIENQETFYRRLEDLQDAFVNYSNESLYAIFIHLFKSRLIYDPDKEFVKTLNIPQAGRIYKTLEEINNLLPDANDRMVNFLRKNPEEIPWYIDAKKGQKAEQFDLDFIDPEFITKKINESGIVIEGAIIVQRIRNMLSTFNLYGNKILKYTVKTEPCRDMQLQFKFEDLLCYEVAKKIGVDDIIPFTQKIVNGIIIYSHISYDEQDNRELTLQNIKDNVFDGTFVQIDFEKALVFSFLTMQQNMKSSDVLVKKTSNEDVLKLYLNNFGYSMSEKNKKEGKEYEIRAFLPCFLIQLDSFQKDLSQKTPSDEIKTLVKNISEESFKDLFQEYQLSMDDQKSFYKRLTDLKNAFDDYPKKSLYDIFIHLFKSCDLFLRPGEVFELTLGIPRAQEGLGSTVQITPTGVWNYKKILGGTVLLSILGLYLYSLFKKRKTR